MPTEDGAIIHTRDAEGSDHAFLRTLHHAAYREVITLQVGEWLESDQDAWFEKGLADASFRIIEVDGVRVGAIGVHEAPDHLFLDALQLLPEFQHQGIGSAVLLRELERAAALGLPVRLRVLHRNRARQLYERHGFRITGVTETHYLMRWSCVRA